MIWCPLNFIEDYCDMDEGSAWLSGALWTLLKIIMIWTNDEQFLLDDLVPFEGEACLACQKWEREKWKGGGEEEREPEGGK